MAFDIKSYLSSAQGVSKPEEGTTKPIEANVKTTQPKQSFDIGNYLNETVKDQGVPESLPAMTKLDLAVKQMNREDLTEEQRQRAEDDFIKAHKERTLTTNVLQRGAAALPSIPQAGKALAGMVSGAAETAGEATKEYFNNPAKAIIAGGAGAVKGVAELGRFGLNTLFNIGMEGAQTAAGVLGKEDWADDLARDALAQIKLNKEFEKRGKQYTETAFGAEAPASAKTAETVSGFVLPMGRAGKALEAITDIGVAGAKTVGGAARVAAEKAYPKWLPFSEEVKGLARGGITEVAENRLDKALARAETSTSRLQQMAEGESLLSDMEIARDRAVKSMKDLRVAENQVRIAKSVDNAADYMSRLGIKVGTGTTAGAVLGGLGTAAPGEETKKGVEAGAIIGGAGALLHGPISKVGDLPEANVPSSADFASKLIDFNKAIENAAKARHSSVYPGQSIDVKGIYDDAIRSANGQPVGTPLTQPVNNTGVDMAIDPAIPIPAQAPTVDAIRGAFGDFLSKLPQGSESAPVIPQANRWEPRFGTLVGKQGEVIGEMPKKGRTASLLSTFEQSQVPQSRTQNDRVAGYGYNPETKTLYVLLDSPTVHDTVSGKGISQYLYGNITPEQAVQFANSSNRQVWLNKDLLSIPDVTGLAVITSPQELAKAIGLRESGKLPSAPATGEEPPSAGGTASQPATPTPPAPVTAPAAPTIPVATEQISPVRAQAAQEIKQQLASKGKALSAQVGEQAQKIENVAERKIRETGEEFGRELRTSERRAGEREQVLTELADINKRLEEQRATEVAAEQETRAKQEQEAAGRQERTRQIFEEERAQKRAQAEDYASEIAAEIARISGIPYEQVVKERRFIKETEDAVTPDKWVKHLEDRLDAELDKQKAREPARELEESKRADIEAEYQKKVERASDVEAAMAERERELKSPTGAERLRKWYAGRERRAELRQQAKEEGRKSLSSFRKEQGVEFPPSEKTLEKENVAATETGQKEPSVPFEEAIPVPQGVTRAEMQSMSARMRAIDKELLTAGSGKRRIGLLEERLELGAKMGNKEAQKALQEWMEGDPQFELNQAIVKMVKEGGITKDPAEMSGELATLKENLQAASKINKITESIKTQGLARSKPLFREGGKTPDKYAEAITLKMEELGMLPEGSPTMHEGEAIDRISEAFAAPTRREPRIVGEPLIEPAAKTKKPSKGTEEPPEAAPEPAKPAPTKPRTPTTRKPLETLAPESPELARSKEITGGFGSTPREEPAPTEKKSLGSFSRKKKD